MDAERRRQSQEIAYISGSTARKLQRLPQDYDYEEEHIEKRKISRVAVRNRNKALSINLRFMVFLAIAIAMTLYVLISYINVYSNVTNNEKKVSKLERILNNKKDDNNATLVELNSSVDLNYIYNIAIEELGMVYSNKGQVILYNSVESDYVRQYQDIPEIDKNSLLSMLDVFVGEP